MRCVNFTGEKKKVCRYILIEHILRVGEEGVNRGFIEIMHFMNYLRISIQIKSLMY